MSYDPAIQVAWRKRQEDLQHSHVLTDKHDDWSIDRSGGGLLAKGLQRVAGVDISFVKDSDEDALAMLAVLSYPELEVLHEVSAMVKLTAPYIPGYLAFREAPHLLALLEKLRAEQPSLVPQVIFVDGNGLLHPASFGLACHLGVLGDIPTIGIGKTMMDVDGLLEPWKKRRLEPGSHELLVGTSGRVWGAAVTSSSSRVPTFVSVGHRISLDTAIVLTELVTRVRIPEPVRAADLSSRNLLRSRGLL